jgi:hypothetical protein
MWNQRVPAASKSTRKRKGDTPPYIESIILYVQLHRNNIVFLQMQ